MTLVVVVVVVPPAPPAPDVALELEPSVLAFEAVLVLLAAEPPELFDGAVVALVVAEVVALVVAEVVAPSVGDSLLVVPRVGASSLELGAESEHAGPKRNGAAISSDAPAPERLATSEPYCDERVVKWGSAASAA